MRQRRLLSVNVFACAAWLAAWLAPLGAQAPSLTTGDLRHPQGTNAGIFAFTAKCASCHDNGTDGAPERYALNRRTPEQVLETLATGPHQGFTEGLSEWQVKVMAVYLGGRPIGAFDAGDASKMPNRCTAPAPFAPGSGSEWNGWGGDAANTRYQATPGLAADDVPKLTLKWAFGFPMGNSAYGQPIVVGGRVFVGADTGFSTRSTPPPVASCGRSGRMRACGPPRRWDRARRRTATCCIGDIKANVYAIDAATGALVWRDRLDTHPIARHRGPHARRRTPLRAALVTRGIRRRPPGYPRAHSAAGSRPTTRLTGTRIWKSYTVAEAPKKTKVTSRGTQLWAPAGSASVVAHRRPRPEDGLRRDRQRLHRAGRRGIRCRDAHDLDTGRRLWVKQVMALDHYVRDCPGIYRPNVPKDDKSETCPDDLGPDFDFGNAPVLRNLPDGRTLIVIGQKSGNAWGLDPTRQGEVVTRQLGLGWRTAAAA
ncbi:MAG: hypothetical protein R2708_20920 [Vicinamibacterales bacterium]